MIIIISGLTGSGKTSMSVMLAWRAYRQGRKVYANFKLNFPFEHISLTKLLKFQLENCVIVLDEGYRYMDSHHKSALTTLISYFVNQSRKRHVDFVTNSQRAINIHPQIRDLAHVRIYCEGLGHPDHPTHLRYTFYEVPSGRVTQQTFATAKLQKLFSLYNPDETYDIIAGEREKIKLKEMIKHI